MKVRGLNMIVLRIKMQPDLKTKALELAERIEQKVTGWDEWWVMNADESACCISFDNRDFTYPERAAKEWMEEKLKSYPKYIKDNGYHIVKKRVYGKDGEIAIEAAKVIRELIGVEK